MAYETKFLSKSNYLIDGLKLISIFHFNQFLHNRERYMKEKNPHCYKELVKSIV